MLSVDDENSITVHCNALIATFSSMVFGLLRHAEVTQPYYKC
jgi:hypothetical protein